MKTCSFILQAKILGPLADHLIYLINLRFITRILRIFVLFKINVHSVILKQFLIIYALTDENKKDLSVGQMSIFSITMETTANFKLQS